MTATTRDAPLTDGHRCPTCGRAPQRSIPDLLLAGQISAQEAPKIAAAWKYLSVLLPAIDAPVLARDVAETVAARVGVAQSTVRNVLSAAHRAGFCRITYRRDPDSRRRAYVEWAR
jgi:hypothetical protein